MASPALDRDRALLQGTLAALPIPAFVAGLDDAILAWNAAADARFGPVAPATMPPRFKELPLSYLVPRLRAAVEEVKAGTDGIELRHAPAVADGLLADIRFSVRPLRVGADLLGVLVTVEDRAQVEALKSQLALVTDDPQATTEQMEQANEELRVTNQELQTANAQLEGRSA